MSAASGAVPAPLRALLVAAAVLFVGAAVLQRAGPAGRSDPIASVDNGGPRGLLLLQLAVQQAGRDVVRVDSDGALASLLPGDGALDDVVIVVPPPEQTAFTSAEGKAIKDLARRGARVVVLCDPDSDRRKRLRAILDETGVGCVGRTDAPPATIALATPAAKLLVRDGGRVSVTEEARGVLPLSTNDEGGSAGAVVVVERGELVVLGSVSALANDGLVEADNAAVLWWLLAGRSRVVVDERHHVTRGAAALQRASLEGPGPLTALLCVVLLVPLAVLALSPRRGELVSDDDVDVPAAVARVRGLAALLASSPPSPSSSKPSSPSSSSSPARRPGVPP